MNLHIPFISQSSILIRLAAFGVVAAFLQTAESSTITYVGLETSNGSSYPVHDWSNASIAKSHDADGIVWPWNVAPFHVLICVLDPQLPEMMDLAKKLAAAAEGAGADVLIDDRAERPGVKFKDADLIGIPLRLTIGSKGLKDGIIEMKWRAQKDVAKVPLTEIEAKLAAAVTEARLQAIA